MKRIKNSLQLGQDLVEYAIIFPVLFMILVGIFDLGRVVIYYSVLNNASREGARAGIIHPVDNDDIKAAVCHYAIGIDIGCPAPLVVINETDESGNGTVDHVTVKVSYQFRPVTPFVGYLLGLGQGGSITLNSQSMMRIEN